jgi:hypothetical protein
MVTGTMIIVGAVEVMLVFVSRPAYEHGISAPVRLFGVLSAVLIAGGLLPQYWEIYVRREVTGVSYTFILIDMLGGLLNDLSLAFSKEFDKLAAASYTAVIVSFVQIIYGLFICADFLMWCPQVMDSVIIFAALYLNPRARKRRRLAATVAEIGTEAQSPSCSTTSGCVDIPRADDTSDIEAKAGLEEKSVDSEDKSVIEEENEYKIIRSGSIPMCQIDSIGNPVQMPSQVIMIQAR